MSFFRRIDSFFHYVYFSVFAIGALFAMVRLWSDFPFNEYRFGTGFGTTEGRVIESYLVTHEYGKTHFFRGELAVVKYAYNVQGTSYVSDRLNAETRLRLPSRSETQKEGRGYESRTTTHRLYVSEYFVGRKVKVYYNPAQPTFAVLDPAFPYSRVLLSFFYLAICAVVFFFVNRHYKSRRRELAPKTLIPQNLDELRKL